MKEFLKMWLAIMLGLVAIVGLVGGFVAMIFFAVSYPWYGIPLTFLLVTLVMTAVETFIPLGG